MDGLLRVEGQGVFAGGGVISVIGGGGGSWTLVSAKSQIPSLVHSFWSSLK